MKKKVKVSFEIENVSNKTIKALEKYLYETLEYADLLNDNEECSNLQIVDLSKYRDKNNDGSYYSNKQAKEFIANLGK